MRRIERSCVVGMQSPIRHLMAHNLGNSVFAVAPERQAEFDTTLNNYDLVYVNERRWKFCADPHPTRREVFVSRGAVELMWCASLAHFLFYTRLVQGKKFDRPAFLDPQSDPRVRDSLRLLRWAIKCQLDHDEADDWPPNLPRPLQSAPTESDENIADELCLVSCAYFLHHELAHIRLGHVGISKKQLQNAEMAALSLSQEKEADIAAAEWVLDGIDVNNPVFVKRMVGIVQGLLLTTAIGLYRGNLGGQSHPFSYDRLSSVLSRFLGDANHVAKGIAFAVLDLHFQNSGRQLAKQEFVDPEEALEAICDHLANEVHDANGVGERK